MGRPKHGQKSTSSNEGQGCDGILCFDMRDALPATCSLCSKEIAPGTRAVYATVENENPERVYHLDCFVVFTTGSLRNFAVWTYRVVGGPAEEEP